MSNIINKFKDFDARQYERKWFNRIAGFIFGVIVMGFVVIVLLADCVSTPEICMCPKENVIVHGEVNGGYVFIGIEAGSLCDSDRYWTEKEFEEDMEKVMREKGEPL